MFSEQVFHSNPTKKSEKKRYEIWGEKGGKGKKKGKKVTKCIFSFIYYLRLLKVHTVYMFNKMSY